jgi:N-acetyl-gamma-glutamyl-phosphate reductase
VIYATSRHHRRHGLRRVGTGPPAPEHPQAKVTYVSSRSYAGKDLNEVFPALKGRFSLKCEEFSSKSAPRPATSSSWLCRTASPRRWCRSGQAGKKVVDIGSDFRPTSSPITRSGTNEIRPVRRVQGPVRLAEFYGDKVRSAQVVANPGCFPTATLLGLAPLVAKGLIERQGIIVDAKTGVSGAGGACPSPVITARSRRASKPNKVGAHQHTPRSSRNSRSWRGERSC